MKPGLPGRVDVVAVEFERDEARRLLLILHAAILTRESDGGRAHEDLYGALLALEEALGATASELLAAWVPSSDYPVVGSLHDPR